MKKLKEKLKYGKKGITLIALVITMIVLLILAGITIATLTGENGILTRAQQAKNETEQAEVIEKIKMAIAEAQIGENGYQRLDQNNLQEAINNQLSGRDVVVSDNRDGTFTISFLDTLKDYKISGNDVEEGIDWNEAMANAVAPESQDEERNDGIIGIGTNGKPVDMDLWEYTLLDDETYGLNDEEALEGVTSSSGYLGSEFTGIIIPQYISTDKGNTFKKVTSLVRVFYNCDLLTDMPIIPNTCKTLESTFANCTNLVNISSLPSSIENLRSTFNGCSSLEKSPSIPNGVTNLISTYNGCKNLTEVPKLPDNITSLKNTFSGCSSLTKAPNIPNTVTDLTSTFNDCVNLIEISKIPNTLINLTSTFQNCFELRNIELELNNVTDISRAFNHCQKISGNIKINSNNIINYEYCFNDSAIESEGLTISGNSTLLNDIFETKSTNSNINMIN